MGGFTTPFRAFLLALLALAWLPGNIRADYLITAIGTPGIAQGMNGLGDVVAIYPAGGTRSFFWSQGATTYLGTLGGDDAIARAVNNAGVVVGDSSTGKGQDHAFAWANGVMTDLGTLGGFNSGATAINNKGQIVGFAEGTNQANVPVVWQNGKATALTLGTFFAGEADGLNSKNQIVGSVNPEVGQHAALWDNGKLIDLGTFGGGNDARAYAINDAGTIAGRGVASDESSHALVWKDGVMMDIGNLGGDQSGAYAINSAGTVVGSSTLANGQFHPFIWRDGVMTDLNDLLPKDSGWVLESAVGITDDGKIAGTGTFRGQEMSYLLTPVPTPPSVVLATLGAALLLLRRGRRQFVVFCHRNRAAAWKICSARKVMVLALAALTLPSAPCRADYLITSLGTLGGATSGAAGINDAGQVVGNSTTADGSTHAFLYTNGRGMTDLGTLGGTYSIANGINNAGQVVGTTTDKTGAIHAFLFSGGTMTDVGNLSQPPTSYGNALNNRGQIAGTSNGADGNPHAFLYTNGRGMTDLGILAGTSFGNGINNAGEVVGENLKIINGSVVHRAFLYSKGQVSDLGTLGGTYSIANAINDSGQVVGYSATAAVFD